MERNYLLIYYGKFTDTIIKRYFETIKDMSEFISKEIKGNNNYKILHKYKIEEI